MTRINPLQSLAYDRNMAVIFDRWLTSTPSWARETASAESAISGTT